jgi:hypothetical protein
MSKCHQSTKNPSIKPRFCHFRINEGLSQLLQFTITDVIHPDWRMEDFMNILTMQDGAFEYDAKETARAMTLEATTPDDIEKLFENAVFEKGK